MICCRKPALALALAIPTLAAHAQQGLEEVIVTARMRAEAYEDAPVAIKAFTAAEIEEAGIETPHDFIGLTPNVTIVQTQNPGNSFVTIRGVSQARNSDMPVAVVVDGVLLSNPAQLNQHLFDIEQIEVLKGPQGALYGRNAIGGAITIVTKQPTEVTESRIRVGADSGPGYSLQGAISGPFADSDTLKYRASLSYSDTDGYLDNEFLNDEADPYRDLSARLKLLSQPNDRFSADARFSVSQIDTTALYFVINDDFTYILPNADALSGVSISGAPNDANDTSVPILVNNPGEGIKDMTNLSLKLDYETDAGTFTSVTAYDDLEELLTGDAFDFRPIGQSFNEIILPLFSGGAPFDPGFFDWNQSQYLEVSSFSQEFRFTSPAENRFRWIAGAYFIETDRFIGTGNLVDTGDGVSRVYEVPRSTTGLPYDFSITNPQATYLSDSQDNSAWAAFTSMSYDLSDTLEGTFSLRYDEDKRVQTTETPPGFIPAALAGDLVTGQVREETWDAWQPKFTLRWQPSDTLTLYGDLSRGFRSGGFNQSGVALAGVAGVFDTFDEQIADTIELGAKAQFNDGRLNTSFSVYSTDLEGAYYFIFLVASSTQNLGSLDDVHYEGVEFELDALLSDNWNLNVGIAITDSEIENDASIPHVAGQEVPLVSDYTFNLGTTWRKPLQNGSEFFVRGDYMIIGDTYWGPGDPAASPLPWNRTVRDDVNVLDFRLGLQADDWSVALWAKNALDEEYNDEYTHPFVWKALPQRWGVQYTKSF
jgi:iron complex outermembrane receptor protein